MGTKSMHMNDFDHGPSSQHQWKTGRALLRPLSDAFSSVREITVLAGGSIAHANIIPKGTDPPS
jgi:hypothetical protein